MFETIEESIPDQTSSFLEISPGWQILSDLESSKYWDDLLITSPEYSIFQSYLWGEHKKNLDDHVFRLVYGDQNGKALSLLQILFKKMPFGLYIGWCPGGLSGDLSIIDKNLISHLKQELRAKFVYLRFSFHREFNEDDKKCLLKNKLVKSKINIAGELSMSFFPSKTMDELLLGLKGNWRHNLKRGHKQNLILSSPTVVNSDEVIELYRSLEKSKNIPEQYSALEMKSILQIFKEKIKIYFAHSQEGQILGLRACVLVGKRGFDFLAATNDEGRKKYASYVLFWEVVKHCNESQVVHYNMMGIDPKNNPGVFNFKQGTGAQTLTYLGEWELGPFWIKFLISFRLWLGKLKQSLKH